MVGTFCSVWIIILYICGQTYEAEIEACPDNCACLGEYADCTRRGFSKIPSDVPPWIFQMNLNNNRIHVLNSTVLENLPQLTELKLNRNKISEIRKETFKNQASLYTLELNRNQLEVIEPLSFKYLEKLIYLKLRKNKIRQILDGAFWGLQSINTLELDWNRITAITKASVYGLSHLAVLSISNNHIDHIEYDSWEFCKDLIELNLATNNIKSVSKNMFKHLSKLEKLNLNENNISYIEEGAFYATPELKILHLTKNKLSWIVEDVNGAFVGLNNLLKLHLGSNNIKSVSRNAFFELKSIIMLDLTGNNISTIQNGAFSTVPHLRQLLLNTTTLLCDCNLQWFMQWLHNNSFMFNQITVQCDYPTWLHGKSILQLPAANFTCNYVRPRLVDEPKVKMALKGDNITLYCKAVSSSSNPMKFIWKRDNIELREVTVTERAQSRDGLMEVSSELQLFNISNEDQGKYQCIVSNSFGTTYSQKSKISVLIYPKFTKMPMNISVTSGNTAKLECAAHGEPQPQVAWQKDGGNDFPAARERRMHVMPTDAVFFIVNVKAADMGVYSCMAHNPAGIIVANATLTVLEMPSFVKPMENKEITAGEPIVIQCMASGSPKPTLTWLKDGGPLKATERHFFTAENQLMIIVNTELSDAGTYECLMNNSLGTEHGSSELLVIPSIPMTDGDMTGIIIITVVCCAVGTSVIWVVIIYQTRKRVSTTSVLSAGTALTEVVDNRVYMDNSSDHSSCKDSGTGDSAKHSSVGDNFNLLPGTHFNNINSTAVISNLNTENEEQTRLSLPCPHVADAVNSHQQTYPRSTNHDRDKQQEQHLIEIQSNDTII